MRRKPGTLLPLELEICQAAAELEADDVHEFHGYELAKRLAGARQRKQLTGYGTLYRALGRLEDMGLLRSRWEDPAIPARENRPGRRLYTLTATGRRAIAEAHNAALAAASRRRKRWVPA